jgi:hypothetical protein
MRPGDGRGLLGALSIAVVGVAGLAWVLAPLSWAEESFKAYDRAGVSHNEQCVKTTEDRSVVVRDVEGNQLQTSAGPVTDPPEQAEICSDGAGIRFQGIESVSAKGMTMYYTWPFGGGGQAPGFVWVNELTSVPTVHLRYAKSNGATAPPAPGEPVYWITPTTISHEMCYSNVSAENKIPSDCGAWYEYAPYGEPISGARFTLMTWSWIDVSGGGIARAAVAEGELFYPANVQPISLPSTSGENRPENGRVTVRYGYVPNGTEKVYGWMVTSHVFDGVCHNHMAYAGGGAPLSATLCPGQPEATAGSGPISYWMWNSSVAWINAVP